MNALGQLDHFHCGQLGSQSLQVMCVHFEAVFNLIGDAALFARSRLHQRVRSDSAHEVRAQVGGKLRVPFVAQSLDAAHNRRLVYGVAFGQPAGRQEVVVLGVIHDSANQVAAAGIECGLCLGITALQAGHPDLALQMPVLV